VKRACSISETKLLFVIKGHTYFDAAKAGCSFAIQYALFSCFLHGGGFSVRDGGYEVKFGTSRQACEYWIASVGWFGIQPATGLFITLNTETHYTHYRPSLKTTFLAHISKKLARPISNGNRYRYRLMSSSVSIAWITAARATLEENDEF